MNYTRNRCGFTLVEMMTVTAISAILLGLAAPSFRNLLIENQISAHVNEFVSAYDLARSEAVMRAGLVTLCRSSNAEEGDSAKCSAGGSDWATGWIVYVENSSTKQVGSRDPGEIILLRKNPLSKGVEVMQTSASKARSITFNSSGEPTGSLTGTGFNFNNDGGFSRQICVARTGRLRMIQGGLSCA